MIVPHYFQREAVEALYAYFRSHSGNPLIGMPTGTGKSVVIALFIQSVFANYPSERVMMATHVKELVKQNAERMTQAWPLAPVGIHSAGLKQRDLAQPIIFGGVASMYKHVQDFGWRDLLLIDEAHLLSPNDDGMYRQLIDGLKRTNPNLKVIGFTATPFRMGQGSLIEEGALFTDMAYDLTTMTAFNRLVAEGFLAPLYPKRTRTELDVSKVGMSNGDFRQGDLEKAVDTDDINMRVLAELCHEGAERNHWLIFASGVDHAEHIAALLTSRFGVRSVAVHSKIPSAERDQRIADFKSGVVRCAVNNNVLTTGFDFPPIDLIGHLRPTMSPGLWVQMNGRGTRPSPDTGKRDCIALDFAGNTKRLGPINDPRIPRRKGTGGDAPVRICEACGTYCHASARSCYCCGHEFTFEQKLVQTASTEELIRSDAPIIETFAVKRVLYRRHVSRHNPNAKPCIEVSYVCGLRQFKEWWHLDAGGRAGHDARDKWRLRTNMPPPTPTDCGPYGTATDAALTEIQTLAVPRAIRVWVNRQNPEIQSVEF